MDIDPRKKDKGITMKETARKDDKVSVDFYGYVFQFVQGQLDDNKPFQRKYRLLSNIRNAKYKNKCIGTHQSLGLMGKKEKMKGLLS